MVTIRHLHLYEKDLALYSTGVVGIALTIIRGYFSPDRIERQRTLPLLSRIR